MSSHFTATSLWPHGPLAPDAAVREVSASLRRPVATPAALEATFLIAASAIAGLGQFAHVAVPTAAHLSPGAFWPAREGATPPRALLLPPCRARAPSGEAPRVTGLWEHTCVELFIAASPPATAAVAEDVAGDFEYWEVNAAPVDGSWNVFRFTKYRDGMAEETALPGPVTVVTSPVTTLGGGTDADAPPLALLRVVVTVPLPAPLAAAPELAVGVSTVAVDAGIGTGGDAVPSPDAPAGDVRADRHTTYWAARHANPARPDFHDPRGFALRVPRDAAAPSSEEL